MSEDWTEGPTPEDAADELAERLGVLGEPVARFTVNRRKVFLYLFVVPLAGIVFFGVLTLLFVAGGKHVAGLAKLLLVGLFGMIAGVTMFIRAYRNRGLRVLVYPEGVVRIRREEAVACFWDEITELWHKKSKGHWAQAFTGSVQVIVRRADGTSVKFDDTLDQLARLGEMLEKQTLPLLLAQYRAAYDAGDTLNFVKLKVSQKGIRLESEAARWSEISEIKLGKEDLSISKKGKWATWFSGARTDIPNFHVLRALIMGAAPVPKKTIT